MLRKAVNLCRSGAVEHEWLVELGRRRHALERGAQAEDLPLPGGVEAPERGGNELLRPGLLQPDRGARSAEDGRRELDDPLQDFREPFRSREVAAEVEQLLQVLGFATLRLVEAGVLERDGRVTAEHLEQTEVVLVELVDPELRDDDHADHA